MPIYEYRCTACGHQIEVIQKLGERPPRKCAHCAGRMEKLISRAAFHLKGGGWYAEGYSKGGEASEAKPDGKPDAKPETKTETKPETKPAAKTDKKAAGG